MQKLVNYDYVDMTSKEISQKEKDEADYLIRQKERVTADEKGKADKASGNKKLKDLGLTDDEITALTG